MLDAHVAVEPPESRDVPWLSIVLGFLPMLPFAIAAGLICVAQGVHIILLATATLWWGGSILCFLAGVRRGLSFRTPGGARLSEIISMLWLFVLGATALAFPVTVIGLMVLFAGYVSIAILDTLAARHQEAPPFFAKLRPLQMAIPILCLPIVAWRLGSQ